MSSSEVANLRQQLELEMEAMKRGMAGLRLGTARHEFIRARMERIGSCQERLASHVGMDAANHLVCGIYMQTMERDTLYSNTP